MSHDATVNAGDIARLVDVGRAAVSNWRRRYADFPQPVGGTASSPLFSLREVEDWLRRNGKTYEVSLADRTWQRLRAAGDDLRLGTLVAAAGELLAGTAERETLEPEPRELITELADERGAAAAFEFLCARYQEAHSRRLFATPPDIARVIADIVGRRPGTVFDPACGLGTLLTELPATATVVGQELNGASASIATIRLGLAGRRATIVAGDSLRDDGFPDLRADAVVCAPPFNERAWGHEDLTNDPRWEYGLPPRGESELAWVQHCLAHVRPGGLVAVLMPPAAAARRPGRRIRGNLLRTGALRAVVSLAANGPDLWLLRRPKRGDRPPSHVLLLASGNDLATIPAAWRRHLADPTDGTPIIDLLDDDVDISPAGRRRPPDGAELVREIQRATETLRAIGVPTPEFGTPESGTPGEKRPMTTVGELVRAGVLTVRHALARMATDEGDVAVLTADDLAADRPPSGHTTDEPGLVDVAAGDVVASVLGAARVMTAGGAVLGPYLSRYRVDPAALDPDFLAGVLRAGAPPTHAGSSRTDVRRTPVPRLPLAEQRRYGAAFRQLADLEARLRAAAAASETLVRLGFDGLVAGHLRPVD
jgi:hypothetical protein